MSAASLSAAKKRRAAGTNNNDNISVPPRDFNSTKTNGLTMQQVISAFNTRITKLEKNIDDKPIDNNMQVSSDEIDTRFQILVNEIQELKDMVLKVQSFTMEVNKTLFNERIKLLSTENSDVSIYSSFGIAGSNSNAPLFLNHFQNILSVVVFNSFGL